jgi:hypothetical protein
MPQAQLQMPGRRHGIDEMLSRDAIRDLVTAYGHFVWTENFPAMVSLFARDGQCELPAHLGLGRRIVGHAALLEFFTSSAAGMRPFLHSHQIHLIDGKTAQGFVYGEFRNKNRDNRITHLGHYEDIYSLIDGVWKFQTRNINVDELSA